MLNQISLAAAGFSIIALILLIFQKRTESKITKNLANTLLIILIGIQLLQALYITGSLRLADVTVFIYLLFLGFVGPLFYLYSQHILKTDKKWSKYESWHFFPVLLIDHLILYIGVQIANKKSMTIYCFSWPLSSFAIFPKRNHFFQCFIQ